MVKKYSIHCHYHWMRAWKTLQLKLSTWAGIIIHAHDISDIMFASYGEAELIQWFHIYPFFATSRVLKSLSFRVSTLVHRVDSARRSWNHCCNLLRICSIIVRISNYRSFFNNVLSDCTLLDVIMLYWHSEKCDYA